MAEKREHALYGTADSIIEGCGRLIQAATRLKVALDLTHADFKVEVTSNIKTPADPKSFTDQMMADAAAEFAKMDWQTIWNEHSQKIMAQRMAKLEDNLRAQIELMRRHFERMPAALPVEHSWSHLSS